MTSSHDPYAAALDRAAVHARTWLASVGDRPVPPRRSADDLHEAFAHPLPDGPSDPAAVVDALAALVEPGLMAMGSGRFFGWVVGGTLPAALAADWLTSAWDQNSGMRFATPGVVAAEEAAAGWLLDLLGLPAGADVGFVTGATMANFTCLAAARQQVLNDAGWDLDRLGLTGAPRMRVLVGAERHDTVDLALRYLGLGAPTVVAADDHGRIRLDALEAALAGGSGPTVLCLQAGNLHSGAFDPVVEAVALAHRHGAWVHVDGAFGLWRPPPRRWRTCWPDMRRPTRGPPTPTRPSTSPTTAGIAVVARPAALRAALGVHASYLVHAADGPGDPLDKVPELSRRARGVPVWAALQSLGRSGVADLVDGLARHARAVANGIAGVPGARVVNDVIFTQVCATFGDDARTRAVTARLLTDGAVWMSGSSWHGTDVLRCSVSSWRTDDADVAVAVDAVRRAAAG